MKRLLLFILLTMTAAPGWCQRWEAQGRDFVLRSGAQEIRFVAPGTIRVGRTGGPSATAAVFLWHDAYIYERLDAGKIESGPSIDEKGRLRQSGTWVSREGAAPIRYALTLEPTATGAILRLENEKTAPLKLTAGIWATISLNRADFTAGQRIYARPTAHAPVGKAVEGELDALLIELEDGKSVAFAPEGFSSLRGQVRETSQSFEMPIRPGDFPVGQKAVATMKIDFTAMPSDFPGEVKPQKAKLSIGAVTPVATNPGRAEMTVDLKGTWDNPYDPDDIALDAVVTTASGRTYTQPGFFLVDYKNEKRGDSELMIPQGHGRWCVRLAATEPGPLRCKLVARDRSGTVSKEVRVTVAPSPKNKGFIRQSRVDPHYLQYDNGDGYVPIGHNVPGYHNSGQTGMDTIRKMASKGENYNRWWMSSGSLGIEWEPRLGWYRQATAARLDALLDLAHDLDFTYMLCMDTHQDFREDGWKKNPFNKANGGPCATAGEWFTDPTAKEFYRKRLRYTVARWGYSTNILTWEFGNEMEGWADSTEADKIAWHREMAAYLAKLDPYRHLITTSWWSQTGPEECWAIPEIDIVQTHCYTNNDANVALQVRDYTLHQWNRFQKPHIFGEFGIRSHSSTADKDPKGWGLHNAYWAGLTSGGVGIPMPWWHENYIDPLDLYFHFTAIRNFTKDLPFGTAKWEQIAIAPAEYVQKPTRPMVRDAVLATVSKWGKPEVSEFTVQPDGSVNDPRALHQQLQGTGHAELRNPPTFIVDYPQPGRFIVSVGKVSNSGQLRIWVDDELKVDRAYPTGENRGKEWVYREQWKLWESVYDEDVTVEIPAGRHRIKVDNLGADWMTVNRYTFTGARVLDRPNLLTAGLRASTGAAIVWLQNQESDWFNHGKDAVPAVPASRVALPGFADGVYRVEWWDTWNGKPQRTEQIKAADGQLVLLPGEIRTDTAARITPLR